MDTTGRYHEVTFLRPLGIGRSYLIAVKSIVILGWVAFVASIHSNSLDSKLFPSHRAKGKTRRQEHRQRKEMNKSENRPALLSLALLSPASLAILSIHPREETHDQQVLLSCSFSGYVP